MEAVAPPPPFPSAANVFPPPSPPWPMDWTAWRDEFPIFQRKQYLNTCSLAPLARRVRAAQERFFDEWEEFGASAWYSIWMGALDGLRAKFAQIIGARKEEAALALSVSVALSSLASSLDYAARPKVVFSELDFPTIAYQWAVKSQVQRVVVPSEDGIRVRPEAYEAAIDNRTAAVATSHVFYTSGAIQDIARIGKAAHEHGALAIIDAYQATGQLPTDVHAAGVDALISGGLKWLLGGTGIAFLYVRKDLLPRLRPTITGWSGTRGSSISILAPSNFGRMHGASSSAPHRMRRSTPRPRDWTSSWRSGWTDFASGPRNSSATTWTA